MSEQQQNGPRKNNNRNQNNRNRNNNRNRSNNNNSNNSRNRKPRQNKPKPLVLSTWQKILIFCKLTSEDKIRKQLQANRPPRSKATPPTEDAKPARTNTRVAKERKAPQKVEVETPRLYVGNLSYDATEYDIEDLFKGVGSVKKVEIIYNRHTHKSKGYGFVQMLNVDEAKRAVDVLHDQPFLGRNLIVNGSKARKASDPNSSDYDADKANSDESSEEPAA
ncbi:MAG: RNA recognition motif domain-containing protein [Akkermansiaceae bacterium]